MGIFDQIDNKTEAHVAASVRVMCIGIGVGAFLTGLGAFIALVF